MQKNCFCLILAGGNGSRLWPVSRTTKPKQFMDLLGTGRTLLQQTYDSVSRFIDTEYIYISTNIQYLPLVYEQLPQVDDVHILEEPLRRGTLAAVAWGSVVIAKQCPHANVIITPSDQLIENEQQYQSDVETGLRFVAQHESLLVTGITPTRPETGYGYIQIDDSQAPTPSINRVKSFTEKPNEEFAQIFMEEGDFLWNTGLIFFNVKVMLDSLYQLVPEYRLEIPRMMEEAENADAKMVPEFFSSLPNLNIDLSILERSDKVFVLKGNFGWADIGTWKNLYDDVHADADGNVILNTKTFLYDCQDNIIRLPEGHTAVLKGLHDYIVAEEGNILMICPRNDINAIRKMHTDTKFT